MSVQADLVKVRLKPDATNCTEVKSPEQRLGEFYGFRVGRRRQGMKVNLTWPVIVLVSPSSDTPSGRDFVVTRT